MSKLLNKMIPNNTPKAEARKREVATILGDWALPSLWAMKYRNLKGQSTRFTSSTDPFFHRPWQVQPVDDMSKTLVVKKGRQMGFTELFITNMVHMATLTRCRTIYTLPKAKKAQEIAKTRIDPVGQANHPDAFHSEVLQRLLSGWRSVMHKQITPRYGGGFSDILITGSWNEDLGESTAADRVLLDEYDRMRPGVISAFRECLSASRIKQLRLFSTPTFPKVGVDGQYLVSDQKKWMYKCTRCGHWQFLSRENLVQVKGPLSLVQRLESHDETALVSDGMFQILCLKCRKPLDRWRAKCEWVAANPQGEISGYAASQLDCVWITADDIMRKLREYRPKAKWFNYALAEGYIGEGGKLPDNYVYQLVDPELRIDNREELDKRFRQVRVSVGVDWGKTNWIAVEAITPDYPAPILLATYTILDTDDIDDLINSVVGILKAWKADVVVADAGYGQDRNPKLYKRSPCMMWACMYPTDRSKAATSEPLFGVNSSTASSPFPLAYIGRAPSLKDRVSDLRKRELAIANTAALGEELDILDMHFRNIAVSLEELPNGEFMEIAATLGPDHLLHCHNYCQVGLMWIRNHTTKLLDLENPFVVAQREAASESGIITGEDVMDALDLLY